MLDVLAKFRVVNYVPLVDLSQDVICFSLAICLVQVLTNPGNKVILKSSLDKLMKDIQRYEFVDISTWKISCKWPIKHQHQSWEATMFNLPLYKYQDHTHPTNRHHQK
jgi:hypothetical protein